MCDCLTLQPPNWKEGYELPEDVHLEAMDAFEITDADGFYESVKVFRGDLYLGQVVGGEWFWEEKRYEIWQSPYQSDRSHELRREDSECEPLVLEDLRHARLEPGAHKAAG
eukprot:s7941_g1.t1